MAETLVLQPSSGDTYLDKFLPTDNFGTQTSTSLYVTDGTYGNNILIKFDLSTLSGTITRAYLSLYESANNGGTGHSVTLYRCLRNWGETTATWNKYDGTNNWTTAGGTSSGNDRSSTQLATMSSVVNAGWYSSTDFNLSEFELMRVTNYGVLLTSTSGQNARVFHSEEYAGDTSLRPKLTIEYIPDSGEPVSFTPYMIF